MNKQVQKLFEEVKEAQDNNQSQYGYQIELNKLGYEYNGFTREIKNIKND